VPSHQIPHGRSCSGDRGLELWRRALIVMFAYGTGVHVLQLISSGGNPYPGIPVWLAAFFGSLVLIDPAVAMGLVRRWRAAAWVALGVRRSMRRPTATPPTC
jgi:hypothetical protein